MSVEPVPSCNGDELLVAQFQALGVWLFVPSAWLQDGGAMELLHLQGFGSGRSLKLGSEVPNGYVFRALNPSAAAGKGARTAGFGS